MNYSVYPVIRIGNELTFIFVSNNTYGTRPIGKIVSYDRRHKSGRWYYNLGFGDYSLQNGQMNDKVVTNNGDMRKVLATVVHTVDLFFDDLANEKILIEGSNSVRNYYYQKLIRDYHDLISIHYLIEGYRDGELEEFRAGVQYEFVTVGLKQNLTHSYMNKIKQQSSIVEEPIMTEDELIKEITRVFKTKPREEIIPKLKKFRLEEEERIRRGE